MTRLMADSINPVNIPVGRFSLVAGYVDGPRSQWPQTGWTMHAGHSTLVRIAVFATTNAGVVLDVETGDATPAQAPGWVQKRRAAGVDPTVYCSMALWPAVRTAFQAALVPEPHYWVAGYPGGGPVIPAGAIAHQYADSSTSGGNWDLSVVADYWPGVDPGGAMPTLDPTDVANVAQASAEATVAALIAYRAVGPDGALRSLYDSGWQGREDALKTLAALAALQGALSADEAAILGAVQGVDADTRAGVAQLITTIGTAGPGGSVDVKALAAALAPVLAPLLPAGATPAQIAQAVESELAAALSAANTGGTT